MTALSEEFTIQIGPVGIDIPLVVPDSGSWRGDVLTIGNEIDTEGAGGLELALALRQQFQGLATLKGTVQPCVFPGTPELNGWWRIGDVTLSSDRGDPGFAHGSFGWSLDIERVPVWQQILLEGRVQGILRTQPDGSVNAWSLDVDDATPWHSPGGGVFGYTAGDVSTLTERTGADGPMGFAVDDSLLDAIARWHVAAEDALNGSCRIRVPGLPNLLDTFERSNGSLATRDTADSGHIWNTDAGGQTGAVAPTVSSGKLVLGATPGATYPLVDFGRKPFQTAATVVWTNNPTATNHAVAFILGVDGVSAHSLLNARAALHVVVSTAGWAVSIYQDGTPTVIAGPTAWTNGGLTHDGATRYRFAVRPPQGDDTMLLIPPFATGDGPIQITDPLLTEIDSEARYGIFELLVASGAETAPQFAEVSAVVEPPDAAPRVVGAQMENTPTCWEIANSLVSAIGSSTVDKAEFTVAWHNGTRWGSATTFRITNDSAWSEIGNGPIQVRVIRSTPECCILRVSFAGGNALHRHHLDLTLRRGARHLECVWSSTLAAEWGIVLVDPRACTNYTAFAATSDPNGDGQVVLFGSVQDIVIDATNGRIHHDGSAKEFSFFIAAVDNADDDPDDGLSVFYQYLAHQGEHDEVVAS